MRVAAFGLLPPVLLTIFVGCRGSDGPPPRAGLDPCAAALATHTGTAREDLEISRLQQQARQAGDPPATLDRLGWMFVAKARLSYDPGFYKLAEQTALCLEAKQPQSPEALLLRGHALHNLHRFREMEKLARRLVAARGDAFDYALLGDALLEQGRLGEAVQAYQKMVDLKPGLQAYSRVAHLRWLKGDLPGAIKLMRMAVQAGSPRTREAVAWAESRLATLELQAGNTRAALASADAALRLVEGYAPALLVRGQVLLAQDDTSEAIEALQGAAAVNPLPEYQWALADVLRAAGRPDEARAVEARLMQRGAVDDPRTFALYLATRGEKVDAARRLAKEELTRRADVFTLDALAWSLAAAGRPEEAHTWIQRALAEGTQDARLFYHAGAINVMAGRGQEARHWLRKASAIQQMLLPSERQQLARYLTGANTSGTESRHELQRTNVQNGPSSPLSNGKRRDR